ncbi:MAG: DUF559 domain-containing protein [Solirubrobacterales bacterium]
MRREGEIARVVERQKSLITAAQFKSIGLTETGVRSRIVRGRLHRIHSGVYATHSPPYSREQLWLAAVLACGPGALLCGLPAAGHWGIIESPPLTAHISLPSGRGRSREGLTVHRRSVDPRDVRNKDGLPSTSVDVVLVDLAPTHAEAELESMLVAAESLGLLRRSRLAELVSSRRGRPGTGRLASILALEPAIIRSDLELLFMPIWREAGVDRPKVNFPISVVGGHVLTVDFAWPQIRMVVEADSQRFHGDWERAAADRERDQLLALEGWVVHRFVRRRIKKDPRGTAERLRLLTAARIAELAIQPKSARADEAGSL